MGGCTPGAGCRPGWPVEPRKRESGQRDVRKAHPAGRPTRTGGSRGNLDARLGRQDACLQAGGRGGGSCSGLRALNLALLRSPDKRAEPGGTVRLTR